MKILYFSLGLALFQFLGAMQSEKYQLAYAYVESCCVSLDCDRFEQLLSEDIALRHQTNQEPVIDEEGIGKVLPLFKKYIFENTSDIRLKSFSLEEREGGIFLRLIVEENKRDKGRLLFEENTFFQFTDLPPLKIRSIDSKVLSEELP